MPSKLGHYYILLFVWQNFSIKRNTEQIGFDEGDRKSGDIGQTSYLRGLHAYYCKHNRREHCFPPRVSSIAFPLICLAPLLMLIPLAPYSFSPYLIHLINSCIFYYIILERIYNVLARTLPENLMKKQVRIQWTLDGHGILHF